MYDYVAEVRSPPPLTISTEQYQRYSWIDQNQLRFLRESVTSPLLMARIALAKATLRSEQMQCAAEIYPDAAVYPLPGAFVDNVEHYCEDPRDR